MRQPFLIVGSPRTGSTLHARVLDAHPNVTCTDEARVFIPACRALRPIPARGGHGEKMRGPLLEMFRDFITTYYQQRLGVNEDMAWGDKFPHYTDSFEILDELFPQIRYVHLTRDRVATVRSIQRSKLASTPDKAARFYDGAERSCAEWKRVAGDRFVTIRYEDGLATNMAKIIEFLEVGPSPELDAVVERELQHRTRYSFPTSW